jgi:hypothetical protein
LAFPNQLQGQFTYDSSNQTLVTEFTYIHTHEGWLYLAIVIDHHSRLVAGLWVLAHGNSFCTGYFDHGLMAKKAQEQPHQSLRSS